MPPLIPPPDNILTGLSVAMFFSLSLHLHHRNKLPKASKLYALPHISLFLFLYFFFPLLIFHFLLFLLFLLLLRCCTQNPSVRLSNDAIPLLLQQPSQGHTPTKVVTAAALLQNKE
jgi:hypothetical protein